VFCILKAAEVALHLSSVHRWCVTGTPIQKGLEGNARRLPVRQVFPYKQRVTCLLVPGKLGQEHKTDEEGGDGGGE